MTSTSTKQSGLLTTWLALAATTVASSLLGRAHEAAKASPLITWAVLGITGFKVTLVVYEFMEVRHAPTWLRRWMTCWLLFTLAALLAVYALDLSMPPV